MLNRQNFVSFFIL